MSGGALGSRGAVIGGGSKRQRGRKIARCQTGKRNACGDGVPVDAEEAASRRQGIVVVLASGAATTAFYIWPIQEHIVGPKKAATPDNLKTDP